MPGRPPLGVSAPDAPARQVLCCPNPKSWADGSRALAGGRPGQSPPLRTGAPASLGSGRPIFFILSSHQGLSKALASRSYCLESYCWWSSAQRSQRQSH